MAFPLHFIYSTLLPFMFLFLSNPCLLTLPQSYKRAIGEVSITVCLCVVHFLLFMHVFVSIFINSRTKNELFANTLPLWWLNHFFSFPLIHSFANVIIMYLFLFFSDTKWVPHTKHRPCHHSLKLSQNVIRWQALISENIKTALFWALYEFFSI